MVTPCGAQEGRAAKGHPLLHYRFVVAAWPRRGDISMAPAAGRDDDGLTGDMVFLGRDTRLSPRLNARYFTRVWFWGGLALVNSRLRTPSPNGLLARLCWKAARGNL